MAASPPVFCFVSDGRYKPYKCPHCFKSYSSKSNLNTHVRDLHAAVPQVFTCPYCNKKYSSKNSLRYHITMYHREEKNRDQALQHAIATAQPMPPLGLQGNSANPHEPSLASQLPTSVQQQQQQQQQLFSHMQQPLVPQPEPLVELSMRDDIKYRAAATSNTMMSDSKCHLPPATTSEH
nr:zinc finger protein 384-like isoform X2 [Cherax quadricarinatus]XP_053633815.1 zinc finger protein 384-like isoform X2 [Cherax quadricarinatus]